MDLIVDGKLLGSARTNREGEKWASIFTLSDLVRTRPLLKYLDYIDELPKDIEKRHVIYEFRTTVGIARARLDLLGFNINGFKKDFKLQHSYEAHLHNSLFRERYPLAGLNSSQVLDLVEALLPLEETYLRSRNRQDPGWSAAKQYLTLNFDPLNSFPVTDMRFAIRALLERLPSESSVVFQFERGYGVRDAREVYKRGRAAALRCAPDSKILILTEGASDSQILQGAMRVAFPHLVDYFAWPDPHLCPGAGAQGVVDTVKGLLSGGVTSRIVALCDNDTEGVRAVLAIKRLKLPSHVIALTYPNIDSARAWPCQGPNKIELADINGRGCSLELYFGTNVLGIGHERKLVHWRKNGVDWQGVISEKQKLQKAFLENVHASSPGHLVGDWKDMKRLLRSFMFLFTNQSDDLKIPYSRR
jgi:hypothetical protein